MQPSVAAQPIMNQNPTPVSFATPAAAVPPTPAAPSASGPQPKVTLAFTITLAILGIAIGAATMYYFDMQKQLTAADEAQAALAALQSQKPSVPFLPAITSPAATGADAVHKGVPFAVRFTPTRLKTAQVAQVWVGQAGHAFWQVGKDGDLKPETGTYSLVVDDSLWKSLDTRRNGTNSVLEIRVGHYNITGSTTKNFVSEAVMSMPFVLVDATSSATTTK